MRPVQPRVLPGERAVTFAKNQPQYQLLPVALGDSPEKPVTTEWMPEPDELARLNLGEPVVLTVWTFSHPLQPIQISVGPRTRGE